MVATVGAIANQAAFRLSFDLANTGSGPAAPLRRLEISFSQGAEWKALISKYIGTIPLSGDPCLPKQSISAGPPGRTPVKRAMIAKVGVAARDNQLAMQSAAEAPS